MKSYKDFSVIQVMSMGDEGQISGLESGWGVVLPLTVRKNAQNPDLRSEILCKSDRNAREPNPAVRATRMSDPVRLSSPTIQGW